MDDESDHASYLLNSVTVTVEPDHVYVGFFESLLASGGGLAAGELEAALEAARSSAFEVFRRDLPLT